MNADSYKYSTALRSSAPSSNTGPSTQRSHAAFAHTAQPTTPSARFATIDVESTLYELRSDPKTGISSSDVSPRRQLAGPNDFQVAAQPPLLSRFITQFNDPLLLLLLGSAFVSILVGNYDDAVSIALAMLIVVTVGFIQEQRSQKSLQALNKLVPHYCHLIRDGQKRTDLANVLVPGDIVTFSLGDRVPADVRLIESSDLEIDESSLTGETLPAVKNTNIVSSSSSGPHSLPQIGDRSNIAFMGTLVRSGSAKGVVVATGDQTEFGTVFSLMQEIEDRKTPLQLSMDELAKRLSAISFVIIAFICLLGIIQHRSWLDMFTIGVSLAVAAIPEGLPIVVSVTLALGVLRMSHRKAIVKKLHSVETLGSVSVICSDKTGTLTMNKMTVTKLYTLADGVLDLGERLGSNSASSGAIACSDVQKKALLTGNICNHSFYDQKTDSYVGKPTEVAMINILNKFGLNDQRSSFTKVHEQPFDSEKKFQSVTGNFGPSESNSTYVCGALESVLPQCTYYLNSDGNPTQLDDAARAKIQRDCNSLSNLALRVVSMAVSLTPKTSLYSNTSYSNSNSNVNSPAVSSELVFLGAQCLLDPPRPGITSAIASLSAAGIRTIMITGDAPSTAIALSRQMGIPLSPANPNNSCMTGAEIDTMSQRELTERIKDITVFARTTPRHKMALIEAFQAQGAIVGMTGDGVNDAPALKMADIGIAMGKGGTDVAKEAADVILVDDNFATILSSVEEGKSIFYNIQNFLCFQLSTAVSALVLITLSTAFRLPTPLNAMQILFINILMDGPPSQSLGVDPVNRSVMRHPPRPKSSPVLTRRLSYRVLFSATVIVLGCLTVYLYELAQPDITANYTYDYSYDSTEIFDASSSSSDNTLITSTRDQTMTFTAFVFLDLVSAVQNRGLHCSISHNKMLVWTVSCSLLAQLSLVYIPLLQSVFQTEALAFSDLFVLIILAAISAGLHELRRIYERAVPDIIPWDDRPIV